MNLRKSLSIATLAVAAIMGLMAGSASAQSGLVEVRNDTGDLCGLEATCDLSLEGTADFAVKHWSNGVQHEVQCAVEIDGELLSDGTAWINDWQTSPSIPSSGSDACFEYVPYGGQGIGNWDDCDDAGFEAYIVPSETQWSVSEMWSDHTGYSLYFPYPCFEINGVNYGQEAVWGLFELNSDATSWTSDPTPFAHYDPTRYLTISVALESSPLNSFHITEVE